MLSQLLFISFHSSLVHERGTLHDVDAHVIQGATQREDKHVSVPYLAGFGKKLEHGLVCNHPDKSAGRD